MKRIVILLALGILLFGCTQYGGGGNGYGTTTPNTSGTGGTTPSGPGGTGATVTVHIKNFAFGPADITIKKGDTVVWANDDAVPHSIKSASGAFDSSPIAPGSTTQHTFTDAPGVYQYSCGIHPSMHGSITITG
jgi:plastocyanin